MGGAFRPWDGISPRRFPGESRLRAACLGIGAGGPGFVPHLRTAPRFPSPGDVRSPRFPGCEPGAVPDDLMKARLIVTPKKAVLDPQGKTVQNALEHMGYAGVTGVHVGKYIEIDLAPGTDRDGALKALDEAAHRFLSNPVIEDYRLEIVD